MLTMLFVGLSSYAQTTVEFVAGVDKGTKTKFTIGDVADEVTKDGVKMHSNNATFATDKYVVSKKTFNFKQEYKKDSVRWRKKSHKALCRRFQRRDRRMDRRSDRSQHDSIGRSKVL